MRALGLEPAAERWEAPSVPWEREDLVPFVRRALCLTADRDGDVAVVLDAHPRPPARALATMWWPGSA